jgi:hypothetical protein
MRRPRYRATGAGSAEAPPGRLRPHPERGERHRQHHVVADQEAELDQERLPSAPAASLGTSADALDLLGGQPATRRYPLVLGPSVVAAGEVKIRGGGAPAARPMTRAIAAFTSPISARLPGAMRGRPSSLTPPRYPV